LSVEWEVALKILVNRYPSAGFEHHPATNRWISYDAFGICAFARDLYAVVISAPKGNDRDARPRLHSENQWWV
jgi:hypothetical protein